MINSFTICLALCIFNLELVTSLVGIKNFGDVSSIRHFSNLYVVPVWADIGTVIAQLTLAPAAVYYMRNQMQEEVLVLNQKVADMEESMQNTSLAYQKSQTDLSQTFANNMKSSVTAYQKLYNGMNVKIDDIIINTEKRSVFEEELTESISELEGIANDILKLKKGGKISKSLMEVSLQNMTERIAELKEQQLLQGKNIEIGQLDNSKERDLMRNLVRESQDKNVKNIKMNLNSFRNDVKEINEKINNEMVLNNAKKVAYEIEAEENRLREEEELIRRINEENEEIKNENDSNESNKNETLIPIIDSFQFEELNEKIKLLESTISKQQSDMLTTEEIEMKTEDKEKNNMIKQNNKFLNNLKLFSKKIFNLEKSSEEEDSLSEKERSEIATEMTVKDVKRELIKNNKISTIKKEIFELNNFANKIQQINEKNILYEDIEKLKKEKIEKVEEQLQSARSRTERNNNINNKNKEEIIGLESTVQDLSKKLIDIEKVIETVAENSTNEKENFSLLDDEIKKLEILNIKSLEKIQLINQEIEEIKKLKEDSITKNNNQEVDMINQFDSINNSINKNFDLSRERMYDKNNELYSLWDINRNKINEVKSIQQALSSDYIDNMEKLEDIQTEQNERTTLGKIRIEKDLRQNFQNIGEKISIINSELVNIVLNTDLGKKLLSDSMEELMTGENDKIKKLNEKNNRRIRNANKMIDSQIMNSIDLNINKLNESVLSYSDDLVRESKTNLERKINEFIVRTDVDLRVLNEKEKFENVRLKSLINIIASEVKSSTDEAIETLQNDININKKDLNNQIDKVDNSVEKRSEIVVERMGFRASTKRIIKKVGEKVISKIKNMRSGQGEQLEKEGERGEEK